MEALTDKLDLAFATDNVNIEDVMEIMTSYPGKRSDWNQFAIGDKFKYTRNLVHEGNGRYNLMLLCWGEGHGSSIHDHADAHCFMKVLNGQVKETLFDWPEVENGPMTAKRSNIYKLGEVAYINDSIGLHRVENPSHTAPAVTIHLYSPPFAACATFDQKSGKKSKCPVTFWSRYGNRDLSMKTPLSAVDPAIENN